jgi:hypothetical protein
MAYRLFAATALALVATAGVAQTPAPLDSAPSSPGPLKRDEIVVVGAKLADLKAEVERCAAGGCTVREDVIATVRYAEAEFREGNYHDARKALGRSVSRTKSRADSDPFAVAELHTARATVAWHFGDQREALRATGAQTRILDDHAPQSVNALMARLRLIQAQYQLDGPSVNIRELENLAQRAEAANQPLIAMRADLGRAAMLYRSNRRTEAKALLGAILASDAPNSGPLKLAAEILDMRLALRDGDMKAVNALIARLSDEQKRIGPTLVWSPELPEPGGGHFALDDALLTQLHPWGSDLIGLGWVDIGYQIGPDGRVEDVEILRGSPRSGWARPLLEMIGRRRFTPAVDLDDMAGRYRVERYTLTGEFMVPKGSMIRRRALRPRFEQIDLTVAPPQPATAPTVPS